MKKIKPNYSKFSALLQKKFEIFRFEKIFLKALQILQKKNETGVGCMLC